MKSGIYIILLIIYAFSGFGQDQKSEVIEFNGFSLEIFDFISETNEPTDINSDTIFISENPCEDDGYYIGGKLIKVYPENESVENKFYFSLHAIISGYVLQVVDSGEYYLDPMEEYLFRTEYSEINQIESNQFIVPDEIDVEQYFPEIKNRFHFQDTSLAIRGEVFTHHFRYKKQDKFYEVNWDCLYIKIESQSELNGSEFKYLAVWLSEGCD